MALFLLIIGLVLLVINIVVIGVAISEGGHGFELDREISVSQLLVVIFILPLATITLNLLRTSPWRCFREWMTSILDYQPFKKKSK
jgi:magnesium-transporting ATPase (P-type)